MIYRIDISAMINKSQTICTGSWLRLAAAARYVTGRELPLVQVPHAAQDLFGPTESDDKSSRSKTPLSPTTCRQHFTNASVVGLSSGGGEVGKIPTAPPRCRRNPGIPPPTKIVVGHMQRYLAL